MALGCLQAVFFYLHTNINEANFFNVQRNVVDIDKNTLISNPNVTEMEMYLLFPEAGSR